MNTLHTSDAQQIYEDLQRHYDAEQLDRYHAVLCLLANELAVLRRLEHDIARTSDFRDAAPLLKARKDSAALVLSYLTSLRLTPKSNRQEQTGDAGLTIALPGR